MVVLSIIVVLVGLLFPVFSIVRRHAKETRSMGNMRQIWTALMIYRGEYEGAGEGGDGISSLGLPPNLTTLIHAQKLPRSVVESGGETLIPGTPAVYTWLVPIPGHDTAHPSWKSYVQADGDEAVFMLDETFGNEQGARWHPFVSHHLIGTHLDGHIKSKDGPGDFTNYRFWSENLH